MRAIHPVALTLVVLALGLTACANTTQPTGPGNRTETNETASGGTESASNVDMPLLPTLGTERRSIPWNGSTNVHSVAAGADGSVWAAMGDGVVRWMPGIEAPFVYNYRDAPIMETYQIAAAPDGSVWTGNAHQLGEFDGSWSSYIPSESDGSRDFFFLTEFPGPEDPIAIASDGVVWTAFGTGLLGSFDGMDWEVFEAPVDASAWPWAGSIDVAPNGTVWIGTGWAKGVFAFDGHDWAHFTEVDGVPTDVGSSVAVAPDGSVWVGSGEGVARFDEASWTVYSTENGLLSDIADVAVGSDGTVWAIHGSGVSRFNGDAWISYPDAPGGRSGTVDASGTLWMPAVGGVVGFDGVEVTRLELPVDDPTGGTFSYVGEWDPILSTTTAEPAPAAATCPIDSDADALGLSDQDRPEPGGVGMLGGVFDTHAGRVVFVDPLGETWTFDVCTNTWYRMKAAGAVVGGLDGGLVYDVDSDRTVALGHDHVSVYNARTNAWTQPDQVVMGSDVGPMNLGPVAYDSISGLIIMEDHDKVAWAYDVDTNTWTRIGNLWVPLDYYLGDFLGYSHEIDRLIFASGDTTVLVDPRSGEPTLLPIESPNVNLGWPNELYGQAGDSVYVSDSYRDHGDICGFDTVSLEWTRCFDGPDGVFNGRRFNAAAFVDDPINNRLVLINGGWGSSADDVWAIDLGTGEWIQLLEASD